MHSIFECIYSECVFANLHSSLISIRIIADATEILLINHNSRNHLFPIHISLNAHSSIKCIDVNVNLFYVFRCVIIIWISCKVALVFNCDRYTLNSDTIFSAETNMPSEFYENLLTSEKVFWWMNLPTKYSLMLCIWKVTHKNLWYTSLLSIIKLNVSYCNYVQFPYLSSLLSVT